jgi:hypothetical protein
MEANQTIHSFRKNESEEVRISLRGYKDRSYVDLRIFFEAGNSGEYLPTRKGLTLDVAFLAELKRGIEKAEQTAVSQQTPKNLK